MGWSQQAWNTSSPGAPGQIAGTVMDSEGHGLTGARVTLAGPATAGNVPPQVALESVTGEDGRYAFGDVPIGPFRLTASLQGFDPATVSDTLRPGQSYVIPPITLKMATVFIAVEAVDSPGEIALEQMHAEEQQRLLGIVPNFFVSYTWNAPPLTTKQKFILATRNASDPGNLLLVGALAGFEQANNAFPGYGQGARGYGKRYGANLADLVAGTYLGGAVLPALFHQDPRYFYKGTGTIRQRFLYAISTAVICRGDNGKRQPAFASILGDLAAGAISNVYYPASDRQGATLTVENGFLGVAGDAMDNVIQEFFLKKVTAKAGKQVNPQP